MRTARVLFFCVSFTLLICAACNPTKPTADLTAAPTLPTEDLLTPDQVWDTFVAALPALTTYTYATEKTTYRDLVTGELYPTPHQASIQGSGQDGRILQEFLGDRSGVLAKRLVIAGVVYEAQLQADLQDTWALAYVPETPADLGQPFVLAELISLGARGEYQQMEGEAYIFTLTVPQPVMAAWLEAQYSRSVEAFENDWNDLTGFNFQSFKSLYDLLAVEQVVQVRLDEQGRLLSTETTIRRAGEPKLVDLVLYRTTYADLNLDSVSVPMP